MKRYIIPLFFFLIAACKSESDGHLKVNGVLINNSEKQTVFLDAIELDAASPRSLDTAILQPGKTEFSLKGLPNEYEGIYRLRFEKEGVFILLVNDRNDIQVTADWKNIGDYSTNSNASNSFRSLLKNFNDRLKTIDTMRLGIMDAKNRKESDSIIKARDIAFNEYVTNTENYLLKYADTTNSPAIALYIVGPLSKVTTGTCKV